MDAIDLASFSIILKRHERFHSVFDFDDKEYSIRHTDIRIKAKLLRFPEGTRFEAELRVDLDSAEYPDGEPNVDGPGHTWGYER